MANIVISDLQTVESEYAQLSDLELDSIVGGKWTWKEIGLFALSIFVIGASAYDNFK